MTPEQLPDNFETAKVETPPVEPQNKQELEIPPEVLEQVMVKVQDINKEGNGLTSLRCKDDRSSLRAKFGLTKLISVLKNGLLGLAGDGLHDDPLLTDAEKEEIRNKPAKDRWAYEARKYHVAYFFANIIGRDIKDVEGSIWAVHAEVSFVFDLRHFKPALSSTPYNRKAQSRTYRGELDESEVQDFLESVGIDSSAPLEKLVPELENKMPELRTRFNIKKGDQHTEENRDVWLAFIKMESIIDQWNKNKRIRHGDRSEGLTINHRIAPRKFIGLVLNPLRPKTSEELKRHYVEDRGDMIRTTDPEILDEDIKILVQQMAEIYQGKEELIMPIYDRMGNLLWPKQMTYEEVKRLEAERSSGSKKTVVKTG